MAVTWKPLGSNVTVAAVGFHSLLKLSNVSSAFDIHQTCWATMEFHFLHFKHPALTAGESLGMLNILMSARDLNGLMLCQYTGFFFICTTCTTAKTLWRQHLHWLHVFDIIGIWLVGVCPSAFQTHIQFTKEWCVNEVFFDKWYTTNVPAREDSVICNSWSAAERYYPGNITVETFRCPGLQRNLYLWKIEPWTYSLVCQALRLLC